MTKRTPPPQTPTGDEVIRLVMALVDRGYAEYNKDTDSFRGTPKARGLTVEDIARIQREGRLS